MLFSKKSIDRNIKAKNHSKQRDYNEITEMCIDQLGDRTV